MVNSLLILTLTLLLLVTAANVNKLYDLTVASANNIVRLNQTIAKINKGNN